jgi:hypothetical protein
MICLPSLLSSIAHGLVVDDFANQSLDAEQVANSSSTTTYRRLHHSREEKDESDDQTNLLETHDAILCETKGCSLHCLNGLIRECNMATFDAAH